MNRTLVIDRSKWRCGGSKNTRLYGLTLLLNSDNGMMCCLGFDSLACGIEKDVIQNVASPGQLPEEAMELVPHLLDTDFFEETDFCGVAISINDDSDLTNTQREEQLKAHFATIGVTVEFVGVYP